MPTSTVFQPLSQPQMAARLAEDIPDSWYVNLGIGVPTLVADHIPTDRKVALHSENGLLGVGPEPAAGTIDPWLFSAGKQHVTFRRAAAISIKPTVSP